MNRFVSVPIAGQVLAQLTILVPWFYSLASTSYGDAAGDWEALNLYFLLITVPMLVVGLIYGVVWAIAHPTPHFVAAILLVLTVLTWVNFWGSLIASGGDLFYGVASLGTMIQALVLMELAFVSQLVVALVSRRAFVSFGRRWHRSGARRAGDRGDSPPLRPRRTRTARLPWLRRP